MTRLLTSTFVLAGLAAALVGTAPASAATPAPKSVAVRPTGRLVAPEIVIVGVREKQGPDVILVSGTRDKHDDVVAANDQRPRT